MIIPGRYTETPIEKKPYIVPVEPAGKIYKEHDMTNPEEAEKKRQLQQQLGEVARSLAGEKGVGDENAVYDGKEIYNEKGEIEVLGDPRGQTIDTKG